MAAYRMTPARRAALEKAQAASARKRRKGIKSRTARLANRKTLAVVAVSGVIAHNVVSQKADEKKFLSDPVNDLIVNRHVEVARYHNWRLNELRALGIPPQIARAFDERAARREAIAILKKRRKKT